MAETCRRWVEEGLENGSVRPIDTTVFERDQVEDALRYMAAGKHTGKVLIKIRDEVEEPIPIIKPHRCLARVHFDHDKTYIITGGLGGVGLEMASWMIDRGAARLVLTSRSGAVTGYQKMSVQRLKQQIPYTYGQILVSTNTALTEDSARSLFAEATELGPIGGIFNLAMVLHDALFENQTVEAFEKVCAPKVKTTLILDSLSRKLCPELDYFVCFSSAAAGKGNAGQSNYGFANSFMERVCEARRAEGFHGLAIQWGAIGDVGVVAEHLGGNDVIIGGTLPQRIPSVMSTMDTFLTSDYTTCSSIVIADSKRTGSGVKESPFKMICHILGVKDPSTLDPSTTLGELGMDSLMAVEIKQALERDYDTILSAQEIRNLKIKVIKELCLSGTKSGTKAEGETDNSVEMKSLTEVYQEPEGLFTTLVSSNGKNVFFFPPIEGNFNLMYPLTGILSRPIVGVNWTKDLDSFETIQEVATFYVDKLIENYPSEDQYDFVGYSFGSLVALEVSLQLTARNGQSSVNRLVMLDGSPDYLRQQLDDTIDKYGTMDEAMAQAETLINYAASFIPLDELNKFKEQLFSLESQSERIKLMEVLLGHHLSSGTKKDSLILATDRHFRKMKMTHSYRPSGCLETTINLIRASNRYLTNTFEEDYGLSKVSSIKKIIPNYFQQSTNCFYFS